MAIPYTPLEGGFLNAVVPGASTISDNSSQVFSFLWVFGVVACVTAGAAVLATSGVRLTAADSANKALEIKKDIKRAVYGILGVLLLWLILNQINPDLLRGNIGFTPIQSTTGTGVANPATPANPTNPTTPVGNEAAYRDRLRAVGIAINKGPCATESERNCTRLDGLPEGTISMLENLGRNCITCSIFVTGGTEDGHSSHGRGLAPVDLRIVNENDALYQHIKLRGAEVRPNPWPRTCNITYQVTYLPGWMFCDEKGGDRHWHVYRR
jgi:hypothetical protein